MGLFPYGAQCCNNCWHWQCHAKRSVRGNPPKEIYTDSNCDKCSRTGRSTLSKDCCSGFSHFDGATITFPLPPEKEEPSVGEVFCNALLGQLEEKRRNLVEERRRSEVEASRPKQVVRACSLCDGTGRIKCPSCSGTGRMPCNHCNGEGGFATRLEVRENYERFAKHSYWLPDADIDLKFYGIGDGDWGPDTIDSFDQQHVICKKDVEVAFKDDPKRHAKEALQVEDSAFEFPESMSESFRAKILDKFETLCKSVDEEAEEWDGSSWSPDFRIKEASVSVKQTSCIVRVTFKDAHGFPYRALVNLANNKVHLYDVDEEDATEVMAKLEEKANAGDADLQNDIGQMYAHYPKFNQVVPKDSEKAVSWFLKAARTGHTDAMDNLGNCYKNGEGVAEDKELAVAWYQKAAQKGLPWGQYHFAKCLLDGTGVEEDKELALHWYLKSARQGLADAQNMVARCAEEGWGMKEDADIAFFWMTRAAEGGHATAMNNLANFYENGYGCEKDSEKESEWRKKAEEHGYVRETNSGW